MMEQPTSESIAERRWRMRTALPKATTSGWSGFDDSLEDFEIRAFDYQYELIGQMVRRSALDHAQVRDLLQYTVVSDWLAFAPLDARLLERYPGRGSPWARFRELAVRITTDLNGPPIPPRPSDSGGAPDSPS